MASCSNAELGYALNEVLSKHMPQIIDSLFTILCGDSKVDQCSMSRKMRTDAIITHLTTPNTESSATVRMLYKALCSSFIELKQHVVLLRDFPIGDKVQPSPTSIADFAFSLLALCEQSVEKDVAIYKVYLKTASMYSGYHKACTGAKVPGIVNYELPGVVIGMKKKSRTRASPTPDIPQGLSMHEYKEMGVADSLRKRVITFTESSFANRECVIVRFNGSNTTCRFLDDDSERNISSSLKLTYCEVRSL